MNDEADNAPTVEEYSLLHYFWTEKGRVDGWSGYDEFIAKVEKHNPRLHKAILSYQTALADLEHIIENDLP